MRGWLDGGFDVDKVAVNVSGKQFERGGFVDSVRAVLEETGIPAGRLELEITESAIMLAPNVHELLLALRDTGVLLSIDDFGTGYSSLSYLKQLPIQKLKIDRSFVSDLQRGGNDLAIVRSVVALARTMGLATLAEGVESAEQAHFLALEGCEQAQGFLFCKPVSAAEVVRFLADRRCAPPGPSGGDPHAAVTESTAAR
jgi:EAL domain-containing protein (putative c-di-GMP-specific phosphodiesterase class I)